MRHCFISSLSIVLDALKRDFGVVPVMATELEWYLVTTTGEAADNAQRAEYLLALQEACTALPLHSLEKERGAGQIEAALLPAYDISLLCTQLQQLKEVATRSAEQMGLAACFAAKPFSEEYGSGLHIHIHLEDEHQELLYYVQQEGTDTQLSDMLSWSIGGLLAALPDAIHACAGSDAAMQRYQPWHDAPIAANWGYNNRTTALRLPDNVGHSRGAENILITRDGTTPARRYKRIEHRAASSEADARDVLTHILSGIYFGLSARIPAPPPTYGNSYKDMAQLSLFLPTYIKER